MIALARRLPSRLPLSDFGPVVVFVVLFATLVLLKGRFTAFDLRALTVNALPLVLLALAQYLVILTRGIDLSLGPIASVAGAVMALVSTANPALGIALPLLVGLGAGLLNGLLVVAVGLPPIIVTLATMSILQGIALIVLPDPGGSVPAILQQILVGGFSAPAIGLAALVFWCLAFTWLLSTRYGLGLRAVGSDEQAAALSGIRVRSTKVIAYVLAGGVAGIAGIYLSASMASGSPTVGDGFILTSIAAVVIGGVPLTGGRGSPLAVLMGALILTITARLLYFAQVSSFYQSLIDGLILLAVVGTPGARDYIKGLLRP
jgi:ribose transport system permease protein